MKKVLATVMGVMGLATAALAQGGLPTNPQPGKCYVKCVTPDVFKNEQMRVMVRPAYKKVTTTPAEYKTETERVMIKEASKRFEYVPATYKTVTQDIEVVAASKKLAVVPAKFRTATKTMEVAPKTTKWELGPAAPECESENPDDCRVWCYREYPARYETVSIQELDRDAGTTATPVPAQNRSITKRVIKTPATTREVPIPAEYTTVRKRVLVRDAQQMEETVPAEYTTISKEVLEKKGGLTVWEEISCELTSYTLLPIYYELGSARLKEESKSVINDKIYDLMKAKPLIKVEISSHTDARGSSSSNQQLSEARAQSVVNYLVARGINRSRLVSRGYGETRLLNRCKDGVSCTEREHQMNRRTEFRVIGGE